MSLVTINPQTNQPQILGRSYQFWVVTGIIALALLVLITVILTYSLVRLDHSFADQAKPGQVKYSVTTQNGAATNAAILPGGFAFILRSATAITASTDSSSTTKTLPSLPYFSIPTVSLTLEPQQIMTNRGSQAKGCNIINEHGTFTHNCTNITNIERIQRPDNDYWDLSTERAGYQGDIFQRYKSGFLVLQYPVIGAPAGAPRLEYTIPGGKTEYITLPADFSQSENDNIVIITDQSSQSTDAYVVANTSNGKFLYMPSWQQSAQAKAFVRTTEINPIYDASLCSLNASQLACYYGPYEGSNDFDNEDDYKKYQDYRKSNPNGHIETTSLPVGQSTTYTVRDTPNASNIYQSTSAIYLQAQDKLYALNISGNNAQARLIATGITSAGASQDSLYYSISNKLYQHLSSQQTTYLRFHTDSLESLNLSIYGDTVLANSFPSGADNTETNTTATIYQLSSQKLAANQRHIQDILPYRDDSLGISFMDYDDSRIYISLLPAYTTDTQTGVRTINQEALQIRQNRIMDQLRQDGLADTYRIIFR